MNVIIESKTLVRRPSAFREFPCPAAMVRKGGLEPPRLSAPPPQDGVSANSTTSAFIINNLRTDFLAGQKSGRDPLLKQLPKNTPAVTLSNKTNIAPIFHLYFAL